MGKNIKARNYGGGGRISNSREQYTPLVQYLPLQKPKKKSYLRLKIITYYITILQTRVVIETACRCLKITLYYRWSQALDSDYSKNIHYTTQKKIWTVYITFSQGYQMSELDWNFQKQVPQPKVHIYLFSCIDARNSKLYIFDRGVPGRLAKLLFFVKK